MSEEQNNPTMTENSTAVDPDKKWIGVVAYITIIGWIVAIIVNNNPENKTEFGSFHIRQFLGIFPFNDCDFFYQYHSATRTNCLPTRCTLYVRNLDYRIRWSHPGSNESRSCSWRILSEMVRHFVIKDGIETLIYKYKYGKSLTGSFHFLFNNYNRTTNYA